MIAHPSRGYGPNRKGLAVIALGCVAAALVGPIVATSASLAYGIAGVLLVGAFLAYSARQPIGAVLIVAIVLVSALNDLPQRLHVGPTTGQGVETLALITVMLLAWLNGYAGIGVPDRARLWPLWLFLLWAVASFAWGHVTQEGIQNVAVYGSFVGMLMIGVTVGRWVPDRAFSGLSVAFRIAALVGLTLYAISYAVEGSKTRLIVSPRPFALFGVLLVAWFTAAHLQGFRSAKWFVLATIALTTLSLSRSALAAQFVIVTLAYMASTRNFRTILRTAVVAAVIVAVALSAVFLYAPLRDRFFSGDVTNVGGVSLNVSGRDAAWSKNWGWFKEKPVIGWGAGSADNKTAALPPSVQGAVIGHPHNDYLRILVDFGVVGLLIWVFGYLRLIGIMWRNWRSRLTSRTPTAQISCAAFLGLVGLGLTMLVDNPLIEVVKMAPLGAVAGLAIGMCAGEADGQLESRVRKPVPVPERVG